ncbi:hypothetical protein RE6C_04764 [Rhodopirellula europaea 6C]|uniref:Uncharacterized protein n=1 Tax=Rhodopirellula europaea 6C TaxID=1263867 RepID=M2ANP4_9BACT|nr:hypothetical protein RE6C_04764 [Rhodopirellula europaea 6C]
MLPLQTSRLQHQLQTLLLPKQTSAVQQIAAIWARRWWMEIDTGWPNDRLASDNGSFLRHRHYQRADVLNKI